MIKVVINKTLHYVCVGFYYFLKVMEGTREVVDNDW